MPLSYDQWPVSNPWQSAGQTQFATKQAQVFSVPIPVRPALAADVEASCRYSAGSVGLSFLVPWAPADWGLDPVRSTWAHHQECDLPGHCWARVPRTRGAAPNSYEDVGTLARGRGPRVGGCGSGYLMDSGLELELCGLVPYHHLLYFLCV
jgi:hypothetical protein